MRMFRTKHLLLTFGFLLLAASTALAQFPVVSAGDVRSWMEGKKKVLLVDTRMPDEYQAGHIPGAVNIPAEQMRSEARRLPKDKSTPIIFYCRGAG